MRLRLLLARLAATEPAALVGAVAALLAVVGVSVAPGRADQATQALVVLLPLVAAAVTRQLVTPTARAVDAEQQAVADTLSALAEGTLDPYLHHPTGGVLFDFVEGTVSTTTAPGEWTVGDDIRSRLVDEDVARRARQAEKGGA